MLSSRDSGPTELGEGSVQLARMIAMSITADLLLPISLSLSRKTTIAFFQYHELRQLVLGDGSRLRG